MGYRDDEQISVHVSGLPSIAVVRTRWEEGNRRRGGCCSSRWRHRWWWVVAGSWCGWVAPGPTGASLNRSVSTSQAVRPWLTSGPD